jgi:predicted nucleic-acid-binding protein
VAPGERTTERSLGQGCTGSKADFADCLLLAGARAAGELPLVTFDKALGKLAGARLL